jgi:hypothetical protein
LEFYKIFLGEIQISVDEIYTLPYPKLQFKCKQLILLIFSFVAHFVLCLASTAYFYH